MAYREVTMIEVKEVLRRWLAGAKRKRIAARSVSIRRRCAARENSSRPTGSFRYPGLLDHLILRLLLDHLHPYSASRPLQ